VRFPTLDEVIACNEAARGNLFEVGVVSSDEGPVIVHAMPARPKYLR
jgi:hypothetical protein